MALLKVVLDTNVILSGLAYPASIPGKIVNAWHTGAIEVFLSDYILDELRAVLPKLRNRHGLTDWEIDDLIDILSFQAELLIPLPVADARLRDEDDQPILGTLQAAIRQHDASYLISGDKDLLALSDGYPILSPAEFWQRHGRV